VPFAKEELAHHPLIERQERMAHSPGDTGCRSSTFGAVPDSQLTALPAMAGHTALPVGWEMVSHAPSPSHTARRWSGSIAAPAYDPAGAVYRPRRPTETPLYPVVQHHLETLLAAAEQGDPMGWGVPTWAERDFRSSLRCGITSAPLR
jgi:hypothetical protein